MTEEQFNALTIMVHDAGYSVLMTRRFMDDPTDRKHQEAKDASERSGKAVEQARKAFVTQPAKEIK